MDQKDGSPLSLSQKPFIQALFCALSLAVIHYALGGGATFLSLILYGFWFLSCIIASLYGTIAGIFTALISGVIYLLFQWDDPSTTFEQFLGFQIYEQPLLWLFSAIVFGEIRSQLNVNLSQLNEHLDKLRDTNHMLQDQMSAFQRENKHLKSLLSVANEKNEEMVGSLLPLLALKSAQVLQNAENTIHTVLDPKKFSIYMNRNEGLELLFAHGWSANDLFPTMIAPDDLLYKSVVIHRETVVSNETPIDFMEKHGIFAAPLSDSETGEVYGMVKIEEMGYRTLDMGTVAVANQLCHFISQVYSLARHYEEATKNSIYSRQKHIYSDAMYQCLYNYLLFLAKKIGFSLSSFHIVLRSASEGAFLSELRTVLDVISRVLPSQALVFQGKGPSYELSVLLPGYTPRQAEKYEQALTDALLEQTSLLSSKVYVTRKTEYMLEVSMNTL